MEMMGKIRRMYLRDNMSLHEIAKRTGLSRNTIRRWLREPGVAAPPKYSRSQKPGKLSTFHAALEQALKADSHRPKRNRRTAKDLFLQIKADGYTGGYKMGDAEAEAFLLSLPGVGKKVARCVLMYSLGRQVFPVDTHCWRIARRLGWVRPIQKDKHCAPRDMDRLQSKIPLELRHSLHVNIISLGREICTPTTPRCNECPISAWCPRIGVPKDRT